MQQRVCETKICDIHDLQKSLTQSWVDIEQNVIEAAIDQSHDPPRSRVNAGGGHSEHMLWNSCSFVLRGWPTSEHFLKLPM